MCGSSMLRHFIVAVFLLEQAVALTSQRLAPQVDDERRALVVDFWGPVSTYGEGLRTMGLIMDLQEDLCGYKVDVLTHQNNTQEALASWDATVTKQYLTDTSFYAADDFKTDQGLWDHLLKYQKIIVAAKLDLLRPSGNKAVSRVIRVILASGYSLRVRTSVVWDDVPFVRCTFRPEASTICPQVAALVERIAQASNEFYAITPEDQQRFKSELTKYGVKAIPVKMWPMRIRNIDRTLSSPREQVSELLRGLPGNRRSLAVMMGNNHPVNARMVKEFFHSGTVGKICDAVETMKSNVKILFLGDIGALAADVRREHMGTSNVECTEARAGRIPDAELQKDIWPQTRAVLNPFFADVESGLSVKSYQAIAQGIPLVTSVYGMRGLLAVEGCAFPAAPAGDALSSGFAQFFVDNIVDEAGYELFANKFGESSACGEGQMSKFPLSSMCATE